MCFFCCFLVLCSFCWCCLAFPSGFLLFVWCCSILFFACEFWLLFVYLNEFNMLYVFRCFLGDIWQVFCCFQVVFSIQLLSWFVGLVSLFIVFKGASYSKITA